MIECVRVCCGEGGGVGWENIVNERIFSSIRFIHFDLFAKKIIAFLTVRAQSAENVQVGV